MKIEFSPNQYRLLLDMLHINDWVLTSHHVEAEEATYPYSEFTQYLLAFAKDFGFEDLVDHYPEDNQFEFSREFEEERSSFDFIDEYDEDNFWEELPVKLAEAEMLKIYGQEKLSQMENEERFSLFCDFEGKFQEILDEHGLGIIVDALNDKLK